MTPADQAFYEWWDAPKEASTDLQGRYLECWRAAVAAERERWVKKAESMMPERGPIRATLTDLVAAIREGEK